MTKDTIETPKPRRPEPVAPDREMRERAMLMAIDAVARGHGKVQGLDQSTTLVKVATDIHNWLIER